MISVGCYCRVAASFNNDDSDIVLRPFDGLIAPPPWHKGNTVLIGDAVHSVTPHFGQGAAIAMEDGIVLAECLATHDSSEQAFVAYTECRYERTKLIVDSGVQIGEWEMNPGGFKGAKKDMFAAQAELTQGIMETMVEPL